MASFCKYKLQIANIKYKFLTVSSFFKLNLSPHGYRLQTLRQLSYTTTDTDSLQLSTTANSDNHVTLAQRRVTYKLLSYQ